MKVKLTNEIFTQSEIDNIKDRFHTNDIKIDEFGVIATYRLKEGSKHFKSISISLKRKKIFITSFVGKKPESLFKRIDVAINEDLNLLTAMQVLVPASFVQCSGCLTWHDPIMLRKNEDESHSCETCIKLANQPTQSE
jgi:hypothetical protein